MTSCHCRPTTLDNSRLLTLLTTVIVIIGTVSCGLPPSVPTGQNAGPTLKSLSITPGVADVPVGESLHLNAVGVFSDGTKKDLTSSANWISAETARAVVNSAGIVKGLSVGAAAISASSEGIIARLNIVVSPPVLLAVTVQPPAVSIPQGEKARFVAIGSYSDNSSRDVTASASWGSTESLVAAIDHSGAAVGTARGLSRITASLSNISGSSLLTVSNATLAAITVNASGSLIPLRTSVQISARGTYTDGSTQDITDSVSWSSAPVGIVSVSPNGVAMAQSRGTATITASSGTLVSSTQVTVSSASLTSIQISPATGTLPAGSTAQFKAMGSYTDGSTQDITNAVAWTSMPASIVAIGQGGMATAASQGSATITAASGSLVGSIQVTVSGPVLNSISISASTPVLFIGNSTHLKALGSYSDGSTQDISDLVSWNSTPVGVVTIDSTGLATGQSLGIAVVTATSGSIVGSTQLEIDILVPDGTVRLTNSGVVTGDQCAMIYVFDQQQEMNECCGCVLSPSGLLTLSLSTDLTSNPLTGVQPLSGTIVVISGDYASNPSCDASSVTPTGPMIGWGTHSARIVSPLDSAATTPGSSRAIRQSLSSSNTGQSTVLPKVSPANSSNISGGSARATAYSRSQLNTSNCVVPSALAVDYFGISPVATETRFQLSLLGNAQLGSLQTQCSFIRMIGGGQGVCTCGTGK